jgi:hypothetical protein
MCLRRLRKYKDVPHTAAQGDGALLGPTDIYSSGRMTSTHIAITPISRLHVRLFPRTEYAKDATSIV